MLSPQAMGLVKCVQDVLSFRGYRNVLKLDVSKFLLRSDLHGNLVHILKYGKRLRELFCQYKDQQIPRHELFEEFITHLYKIVNKVEEDEDVHIIAMCFLSRLKEDFMKTFETETIDYIGSWETMQEKLLQQLIILLQKEAQCKDKDIAAQQTVAEKSVAEISVAEISVAEKSVVSQAVESVLRIKDQRPAFFDRIKKDDVFGKHFGVLSTFLHKVDKYNACCIPSNLSMSDFL